MWVPQFRVRTLMLAVLLLAVLIGSVVEGRRLYHLSEYYYVEAEKSEDAEQFYVSKVEYARAARDRMLNELQSLRSTLANAVVGHDPDTVRFRSGMVTELRIAVEMESQYRKTIEENSPVADYHAKRKREYRRAAKYPWMHVPPGPPEPESVPESNADVL